MQLQVQNNNYFSFYTDYFAVTLIWRFGGVALQPPIIMSWPMETAPQSYNKSSEEV